MVSPYKITSLIAGGLKEAWIGFYDDDGYFCGEAGKLEPGEHSEMGRWVGMQNADMAIPEIARENVTGDDTLQGVLTFESEESLTVGFQLGVWQADIDASVQNIHVYDDEQIAGVVLNPRIEQYGSACMLLMSKAKQSLIGVRSAVKGWDCYLLNEGEIASGGPDGLTERTKRNYGFNGAFIQTGSWPWGAALRSDSDAEGTEAGAGFHYGNKYRTALGAFRSDGTEHTIPLVHTPVGDHTTTAMKVWKTDMRSGTVTALTPGTDFAVSVTNKQLILGAADTPTAPAEGGHYVYRYLRIN